jgi:endonuclease YncB( thermonuclease family)
MAFVMFAATCVAWAEEKSDPSGVVTAVKDGAEPVVAVVYHGDVNINGWMVKQGHAWAYGESADAPDYCVWESAARSLRRGLWSHEEWLAPWEWRQGGRGKAIFYTDYRRSTAASCIAEMRQTW